MTTIQWLIDKDAKRRIAEKKRWVAYNVEADETLVNIHIVTPLDFMMCSKYVKIGKRTYIPIKDLINGYVGDTQKMYIELDAKIRSWAERDNLKA